MVTISSLAAATDSALGVCANAGPADKSATTSAAAHVTKAFRIEFSPGCPPPQDYTALACGTPWLIHLRADIADHLAVFFVIAADTRGKSRRGRDVGLP